MILDVVGVVKQVQGQEAVNVDRIYMRTSVEHCGHTLRVCIKDKQITSTTPNIKKTHYATHIDAHPCTYREELYCFDLYHSDGYPLTVKELQQQIEAIMAMSKQVCCFVDCLFLDCFALFACFLGVCASKCSVIHVLC